MSEEPAIIVRNVKKRFKIPLDKTSGIKQLIVNFYKRKKGYREFKALDGVSFEVKKGEFLGVVGRNGSGKSTLLKILAGVYNPDSGDVQVNGSLTPFIELGVGFNMELSGRENVYLNGALLGFSRDEMDAMYDEIVDFAELHDFMEERLKNYSSGMQVRLAFSIAIRANTDILILDEVLAVGDEAFQRKCYEYFAKLKKNKKTVILVTHSMDNILQFCTEAILVDSGKVLKSGNPLEVARAYKELNSSEDTLLDAKSNKSKNVDANVTCTKAGGKVLLDMIFTPKSRMNDAVLGMGIYRETGEQIFHWASDEKKPALLDLNSHTNLKIELTDVFPVGKFSVSLFVRKRDRSMDYAVFDNIANFEIKNLTPYQYATRWKIPERNFINDVEVKNVY